MCPEPGVPSSGSRMESNMTDIGISPKAVRRAGTAHLLGNADQALAVQERVIHTALGRFAHDAGRALLTIREDMLYRAAGFDRFEDYCRQRWSFSRQRAHQLICFFRIVTNMSTIVDMPGMPLPRLETQARPLLRLKSSELQYAAWKDAVDRFGENPSEADVQTAVDYRLAIEADPTQRELPRDDVIHLYRAENANDGKRRRPPAKPLPGPCRPDDSDGFALPEFRTVQTMVTRISRLPKAWLATLTEHERPKVNDLIGDLNLLAERLGEELDRLVEEGAGADSEAGGNGDAM